MIQRTYGIVGRGKLARHLHTYFSQEGLSVTLWYRGLDQSVEEVLASCDVIIVAIKDDAIESWVDAHKTLTPQHWVHCSGALNLPGVHGVHPLYTFTQSLYDLETYRRIPFILDEGDVSFKELFPDLGNPYHTIRRQDKTLYHSLCVIMGNLPTLLWQQGFKLSKNQLHLAPSVFSPFLEQTLLNTINNPDSALTGPIERGDWQTIEKHMDVLPEGPMKLIYQQFLTLFSRYS